MERTGVWAWMRRPLSDGWVAVVPQGDTAQAVHVVRGASGRPVLRWACRVDWQDPRRALRELRRARALQRLRRVLVLQRHQYQLLATDAPDVPRDHWADAVRWQVKDLLDFPVDQARLDLLEIPAEHSSRGRPSVLAAVAPRSALVPWAEAADRERVPWMAMDLPETGLRNLAGLLEEPGRGLALLQIAEAHSTLVITAGGELLLTRHIDVGRAALGDPDADTRQQAWDRAGLELQRTLDSFERLFSRVTLSRLRLSADAGAFAAYVADLVYVPVDAADLSEVYDLHGAAYADGLDPDTVCRIALGAALRG